MAAKVKTQVVFPKSILRELDQLTAERRRSEFVVAATAKELNRLKFKRVLAQVAGSWSQTYHPQLTSQGGVAVYLKRLRRPLLRRAKRFERA